MLNLYKLILKFAHDPILSRRALTGCHYGFAPVSILRESTLSTWHPLHGTSNLTLTLRAPSPFIGECTVHRGLGFHICVNDFCGRLRHRCILKLEESTVLFDALLVCGASPQPSQQMESQIQILVLNVDLRSAMLKQRETLKSCFEKRQGLTVWPLGGQGRHAGLFGLLRGTSMPFWALTLGLLLQTSKRRTGRWP